MASQKQVQKSIRKVDQIQDEFIKRLDDTYFRLNSDYSTLLAQIENAEFVDVAIARAQVQQVLINSGYFKETGNLLNEGYQELVNESFDFYKRTFRQELQFAPLSLQELNTLKQLDFGNYNALADDAAEVLNRNLINMQFGAISREDAIKELNETVVPTLRKHTNTWVRTGTQNYYTDSNTKLAEDNDIKKFQYVGPIDAVTRPFGRKWIGKVMSKLKWNELKDDPSRDRSAPLPVSTWLTGWNHRGTLIGFVV